MQSYNVENEFDFQNMYFNYLKINGLHGLDFETLDREVWLDNKKKNRIDIVASYKDITYYYELKDYRKLTASQVYYLLGELFLQLERYSKHMNIKRSIKGIILMPKNMPTSMIEDIIIMFRARNFWLEIFTTDNLYLIKHKEIEDLKRKE